MPFIPHTPESLIARSDSRDPAATCRGVTSTGRPCRRAVPGPPRASESAILLSRNHEDTYCWQHKDQAVSAAGATPHGLQNETIKERTSIDTLADRLGLVDIQSQDGRQRRSKRPIPTKPGPISTEPGHIRDKKDLPYDEYGRGQKNSQPKPAQRSRLDLFLMDFGLFCCLRVPDDKPIAPRPIKIINMQESKKSTMIRKPPNIQQSIPGRKPVPVSKNPVTQERRSEISSQIPPTTITSINKPKSAPELRPSGQSRPSLSRDPSSKTEDLLSFIPKSTTPEITSLLLAELAKPVSPHDEEGYIYMFWLTLAALPPNASAAATSLLEPPTDSSPSRPRPDKHRPSSVLQTFSSSPPDTKKTVLLKIGRASNVQRRLNEWSRQCGYNVSLIRYYPYHSTSRSLSPAVPSKVPHAHKVERLIHIELSARRAQGNGKCSRCGSLHREWFEVEATREAVRDVDEVVRRWVDWGVRNRSSGV